MKDATLSIVIPAAPTAIQPVLDEVTQILRNRYWSEGDRAKVDLALREALSNAIRHGCKSDPTLEVQCTVTCDDEADDVVIVVRDPGSGFDAPPVPDPVEPSRLLRSGGRGVFLIHRMMDEVSYAEGGREVRMRKHRSSPLLGQAGVTFGPKINRRDSHSNPANT